MKEKYNFLLRACRRAGALVLTLTAAVSLGCGEAFAEEDAGSGEPFIVLGRQLNFIKPEKIPLETVPPKFILWRILFPIKTEGRWDGFFGYVDFTNYATDGSKLIKGGTDKRDIWGPVYLKDDCVSPFSKADFRAALKKMENEAPIIVLDRLKWKGKVSSKDSKKPGTSGEADGGDGPEPRSDLDPVTLAALHKFEGKYAALFREDLRAGWVCRGGREGFEIELAVDADVPVKPEAVNLNDSVVLLGKEYYKLKGLQLRAWRVLEAMPKGQGGSVFLAEEGFYAAPPFNYYYVLTPFEKRKKPPASFWPGAGGFFKEDVVGKELILCLKVAPDDPIYAPGYVVARAKLFEGEVVSALNSDFDSRIYFDTNLTDEYLERILKYKLRDGPVKLKIIRGQDDDDPDRAEDDPKDKEVCVVTVGLTGGEEKAAQAFATLRRQIKKDERIKLSLVCNPDGELVSGKRENNGETTVYFNTPLTNEELEKRLDGDDRVKVTLFRDIATGVPVGVKDWEVRKADEKWSEWRITFDKPYTLNAGEELKMKAYEHPNARFVLWMELGARGKITEVYVTTDIPEDDFRKVLENDGYKLTKMKSGPPVEVKAEEIEANLVGEEDKPAQASVTFKPEQTESGQKLLLPRGARIGIEIPPGEGGDRSLKIGNTIGKVGPSEIEFVARKYGIEFEDTVEEVKGSAFKDERTFSAQALFEGEVDARNARVKVDYQDYVPLLRGSVRGRLRWKANADFVSSEVEEKEYVDAALNLLLAGQLYKTSRKALDLGAGGNVKFFYIPSAPKAEEFTGWGLGLMAEGSYSHGNLKEQKNVGRGRASLEISNVWEVKVAPTTPGEVPVAGPWERFWQVRVPLSYSYSFDGFRLGAEVAPSFLKKEDRVKFRIREQVPIYYAMMLSLDPKFVSGLPQLDSQSAMAVNFVYEHGLRPPRLGERGLKISIGIEYAPVTK